MGGNRTALERKEEENRSRRMRIKCEVRRRRDKRIPGKTVGSNFDI